MSEQSPHTVIVTFQVAAGAQAEALHDIAAYVERFLSKQPGFIESTLHEGLDGTSIVHYAQWTSEEAFSKVGETARQQPEFPKLMKYQPTGRGYTTHRNF